jgi:hypothetical protein
MKNMPLSRRAIGAGFVLKSAVGNAVTAVGMRVASVINDDLRDEHKAKIEKLAMKVPLVVESGAHVLGGLEDAKQKQEDVWQTEYLLSTVILPGRLSTVKTVKH